VPHESVPPQPSLCDPQFFPSDAQVIGAQQTLLMQLSAAQSLGPPQARPFAQGGHEPPQSTSDSFPSRI
jgi:hypothetical protein